MATKTCTGCKRTKSRDEFYMRSGNSTARRSECKTCTTERAGRDGIRRANGELVQRMVTEKACSVCKVVKPAFDFHLHRKRPDGLAVKCKACRSIEGRARRYSMDDEEYRRRLAEQDGACAICGQKKPLVVDHCHAGGQVRALLCANCNSGLGQFFDNPNFLRAAAVYVER